MGGGRGGRVAGGRRGGRGLLLFLSLVAEPHADLLGKQVQLVGNRLNRLSVGPRVLPEELVQRGLGLGSEHSPLLPLPRRHDGKVRAAGGDTLRKLRLL